MPKSTLDTVAAESAPSSIGERFKRWRRSRHETQDTLAKILEVDVGVLRKYENGVNAPGSQFLLRVCNQGLNINWLLTGAGTMTKPDVLAGMAPELSSRLLDLANVLAGLQAIDHPKFEILVRGFTERTKEAHRTAQLELQAREATESEAHLSSNAVNQVPDLNAPPLGEVNIDDIIKGELPPSLVN